MQIISTKFKHPTHTKARPGKGSAHSTLRNRPMKIEILQGNRVLQQYNHAGRSYIEAPPAGDYIIRLSNPSSQRKLAVLSVDGINVVDGETAGYDGMGYVLFPWQSVDIKGWRRSDSEVATFQFKPEGQSLSAKTGKGTSNTGVIGLAVFDEKMVARNPILRSKTVTKTTWETEMLGFNGDVDLIPCSANAAEAESSETLCSASLQPEMSRSYSADLQPKPRRRRVTKSAPDLGTGYGHKATMHTTETTFDRQDSPTEIITLQYAVQAKLIEWGVPVPRAPEPDAFPASSGAAVAPPPGWRG